MQNTYHLSYACFQEENLKRLLLKTHLFSSEDFFVKSHRPSGILTRNIIPTDERLDTWQTQRIAWIYSSVTGNLTTSTHSLSLWRLGARDILELPLFAASSKMETALMAGKLDNPAMSPHALDKTGTRHTDTQWKANGGEGGEQTTAKRSTHNAPISHHTEK